MSEASSPVSGAQSPSSSSPRDLSSSVGLTPLCQDGQPCRTPSSGGACAKCGYPRAYAHPSSLLDAFRVDAIWIGGTAILVKPQRIPPGSVRILQRDGSYNDHPIPKPPEDAEPSSEDLDAVRRPLLLFASRLLCEKDKSSSALAGALVDGLAAMSNGWLSSTHRAALEHFTGPSRVESLVQSLLREVDRRERLGRSISGPGLTVHDNRPSLTLQCAAVGMFAAPLSRIRLALLPGEAGHVELYDVRVGQRQDYPIGTSVISRIPGYGPETVRETPDRVDIGGTLVGRYLPGAALAGQLRNGADASQPARLAPEDLLGGVEIDLGRAFPPMSYVYLFYRVAPGHVFCAVVDPRS